MSVRSVPGYTGTRRKRLPCLPRLASPRQSWSCSVEYSPVIYVYERHLRIMRYLTLAYRRRWLRRLEGRPKRKIGYVAFLGYFVSVFGSVFFFGNRQKRSKRYTSLSEYRPYSTFCTLTCLYISFRPLLSWVTYILGRTWLSLLLIILT